MTVKVTLNTQRATKRGLYPLVIRVFADRKKRLIYTAYYLKKEWLSEEGKVTSYPSEWGGKKKMREINRYLGKSIIQLRQLAVQHPAYTLDELVEHFKQQDNLQTVRTWFEHLIDELVKSGAASTAANYYSTLRSILAFCKEGNCSLTSITPEWLKRYTAYLSVQRRLKANSVNFYIRILRAAYNKAVVAGVISGKNSPFARYSFTSQPTRKRAIKRDTLRKLLALCEQPLPRQFREALDILAFSFYARGMNFIDMARLKKQQIEDGYIVYRRSKTGKNLYIRITSDLQRIINRYIHSDSPYLFPFLGCDGQGDFYLTYRNALARINRNLKKIGEMLKLTYPLTTYVARHSWASLAQESGVSVDVIRQSMGHSSIRTTEIYLSGFERRTIDRANEKVMQWIWEKKKGKQEGNSFLGKKETLLPSFFHYP